MKRKVLEVFSKFNFMKCLVIYPNLNRGIFTTKLVLDFVFRALV